MEIDMMTDREMVPLSKFYLNEHGMLVFRNKKNPYLFAVRSYRWVDRITLIDETEGERRHVGSKKYSDDDFILHEWEPMTKEIYSCVKGSFSEGYKETNEAFELKTMFKNLRKWT